MVCDFGDVVVVPFPFVDRAADKRRPSVILSSRDFNASHGHSICAMVTTAARSRWPSDVTILDLAVAGLPRSCILRWKLFTLPNELILRRAGRLAAHDRNNVSTGARTFIA